MDANAFALAIETHRGYLMRVARLQLRDAESAEDAVQDTLVAAIAGREGYTGKASLKTWLTGILKHKIVDAIRRRQKAPVPLSVLDDDGGSDAIDAFFDDSGGWESPPAQWGDPERALQQADFMRVLDLCLEKLPANTARVFVMREVLELDGDEICKELAITANNLWVILYRARLSLRQCLEQNWFEGRPA